MTNHNDYHNMDREEVPPHIMKDLKEIRGWCLEIEQRIDGPPDAVALNKADIADLTAWCLELEKRIDALECWREVSYE